MSEPFSPQSPPSPTQIVQLTPPGRGAIATLLVEGSDATERVEAHFHPAGGHPLREYPLRQIVFGHFGVGSHPREALVVCRRSAESVELHCHGGHVAATRILEVFAKAGCRAVSWRGWAADRHRDPIAAAAFSQLADARTERTAAVLLDQYHGALRLALEAVARQLRAVRTASALGQLQTLLARADVGRHLVQPWRAILAGSPNVGKSSLINALVGHQRAIVHPAAGTTRDVVSAATAVDGWPVDFADTAGLHEGDHPLEQAAVQLARQQLDSADLALLVFDSSRPWTAADQALIEGRPDGLVIHNKCDLPAGPDRSRPGGLSVSALADRGIDKLLRAIVDRLVPDPPPPGAAVPFTVDQVDRIEAARAAAQENDVASALAALESERP